MSDKTRSISKWRRRQVVGGLLLTFVTLIGAGLRLRAFGEPPWLDELHTGWVVAGGAELIRERASGGNQAAAYFWLPWLSTQAFGLDAFSIRLPSLLAGVALIPAIYVLVRRGTGSVAAGLTAAALTAIDRDCVFYAVEARTYAVVQCLGVVHLVAGLAAWRRDGRAARLAWLASAVGLFYLHYTTALWVAAELLAAGTLAGVRRIRSAAGTAARVRAARRLARCAVGAAGYLAGAAPALAQLAVVAERRRNWGETLAPDALATLLPWGPYFAAPALALAATVAWRALRKTRPWLRRRRPAVSFMLAALVAIPVLVAVVATASGQAQLQRYRYLILSATLAPGCAAACVAAAASRRLRIGVALATLVWACDASEPALRWRYPGPTGNARHEDWRSLAARLNDRTTSGDRPVLLCGGMVEDRQLRGEGTPPGWASRAALEDFCRFPLRSLFPVDGAAERVVPIPTTVGPRTNGELRRRVAAAGGAWLVVRGSPRAAERIGDALLAEFADDGLKPRVVPGGRWEGLSLVGFEFDADSRLGLTPRPVARLP